MSKITDWTMVPKYWYSGAYTIKVNSSPNSQTTFSAAHGGHEIDDFSTLVEALDACSQHEASTNSVEKLFDTQINMGYPTCEPTIRDILIEYYASNLNTSILDAGALVDRYIKNLVGVK